MRLLLKNGKIYDGTGNSSFVGDILIDNDRIIKVGENIDEEVDKVIDINGLSISSGFIDGHSHNDWFAIKKDPIHFFEPFLRQGITTYVTGNCGLSATAFSNDSSHIDKMGGGLFSFDKVTGIYGSVKEYFDSVGNNCPANIVQLAGHCSARTSVAGFANKKLSEEEEQEMLGILEKSLQEGAAGISLGLMYEPGLYADSQELRKIVDLCVKYNKLLTVHARACSAVSMAYPQLLGRSHLLRAVDELVQISKGTNLKLQYSHAIFVGRRSFKDKDEFVNIIDKLNEEGIDAKFDIYNETKGVSVITVILPAWYQSMSAKEKNKLSTKLKLSILVKASSLLLGFGFKDIEIAYIGKGYEKYEGKTVYQIAKEEKTTPLKAYLKLCELSNFKGRVNMGPYSTAEIISQFEKDDRCLFMTDAWVEEFGVQNPSIYACYPRFLKDALLGRGAPIEKTIRKMTGLVADRFMIDRRGYIKEGYYADLTIFDEEELKKGSVNQNSSFGIKKVFVNGRLVLDNEVVNKELFRDCGRALPIK